MFTCTTLNLSSAKAVFGELRAKKLPPLSSLKMLLPYVIVVGCSVGWFLLSPSKIAEHHTVACMSFEGLLFAYALVRGVAWRGVAWRGVAWRVVSRSNRQSIISARLTHLLARIE